MSEDETSAIAQDNLNLPNPSYGAISGFRRSSTHIFDHNIRPSTPPLHRIETAPFLSQSVLSTSTIQSTSDQMVSTISTWLKIGYGFGHIFNDLCAGVWFSYLLLFMKGALKMPGKEAGFMMMLGQVGDALATPVVGYLVDKFGTKQTWHIFGKIRFLHKTHFCVLFIETHFSIPFNNLFKPVDQIFFYFFTFFSHNRHISRLPHISNAIFHLSDV